VSPYAKDQLALAQNEVSNGMSADARAGYDQETDKDLSASLDAILKGGGSVNNVGEVFDHSQTGRQRFAMMKESVRMNDINNLMSAYNNMGEQSDKQFQFNEWAPWADRSQANAEQEKAGQNMMWSGISGLGSSIGGAVGGVSGLLKGGGKNIDLNALPSSTVGNGANLATSGFNPSTATAASFRPSSVNNNMPDLNLYNLTGSIL
jgi:hypothetical protein